MKSPIRSEAPPPTPQDAVATMAALRNKVAQLDRDVADSRSRAATSGVNAGLKMILVAVVVCVLISWIGTVGVQYVRLQMVAHLAATDQDSLRVMCAVDPPKENEFNRIHLCEVVATGGSTLARN